MNWPHEYAEGGIMNYPDFEKAVNEAEDALIGDVKLAEQMCELKDNAIRNLTAERDYYKELAEQADRVIEFRKTEPPILQYNFAKWVQEFKPIMKKYEELKSKQP